MVLPDKNIKCPATGFARTCREVLAECECPKFVSIKGSDPQTGAVVDRHGCIDSFLPMLLIENAQMSRQTAASIDALRGEMKEASEAAEQTKRDALASFARMPRLVRNEQ